DQNRLEHLYQQIDELTLRDAVASCRHSSGSKSADIWTSCAPGIRLCAAICRLSFGLPFQAETGSKPLLAAVDLVRRLDSDELGTLPVNAPSDFVTAAWRAALEREDGSLERNLWEIGLALAVRDALRAGNLHLA